MESEYAYNKVDSASGVCRVLELLPGAFEDDIVVAIKDLQLVEGKSQTYQALSYTWGSNEKSEKIYVLPAALRDRKPPYPYVPATENLVQALRHLRDTESPLTLWADAVCINQNDKKERGEQVQLMPLIYRSSSHLWIWLGVEADDSSYAIDYMRWWSAKMNYDDTSKKLTLKTQDDPDKWMVDPLIPVSLGTRNIKSFKALIGRPWFERTWIRQEVHLAFGNATVVCGTNSIPWQDFLAAFFSIVIRAGGAIAENSEETSWFLMRQTLMMGLADQIPISLCRLMDYARDTKCSDPRDKIFAILGMLHDLDAWILNYVEPDYDIDVGELYKHVSRILLAQSGKLEILNFCETWSDVSRMPTWTVNWDRPKMTTDLMKDYYADADSAAEAVTICGDVVNVKGAICDVVDVVEHFDFEYSSFSRSTLVSTIQTINDTFLSGDASPTESPLLPAILYVLTKGEIEEHASEQFTQGFCKLEDLRNAFAAISGWPDEGSSLVKVQDWDAQKQHMRGLATIIRVALGQRSLIKTRDGRMGLAPLHTRREDVMAVLLGLQTVAVLRPQVDGTYKLVGTSHVHGLMWGEGLLGPFQDPKWRFQKRISSDGWLPAFQDVSSDTTTLFDPRVDWDALVVSETDPMRHVQLSEEGKGNFKRPDAEYFTRHGVQLQTIAIV
jgi:hypothetical protein